MEDIREDMSDAQKHATKNRHMRLVKPYFQDCLMQEKAAEFGRAFNQVCLELECARRHAVGACILVYAYQTNTRVNSPLLWQINNLSVRKVEVLRALVFETDYDSDLPNLYRESTCGSPPKMSIKSKCLSPRKMQQL